MGIGECAGWVQGSVSGANNQGGSGDQSGATKER